MLYVTTRSDVDVFTCARAIRESRGSDGGLYVPFRLPHFSAEEISALGEQGFSACVCQMLNLLFGTRMGPWDVSCRIGRYPVRLVSLNQKLLVAECWHNEQGTFQWLVSALTEGLCDEDCRMEAGSWLEIGVGMAVLHGIFAELIRDGIASWDKKVDISVVSGNFSQAMSAWYVREMGLPVGNIILSCNENNSIWELLHQGQLRTDQVAVRTSTPDADVTLPVGLERLIFAAGGRTEVHRFLEICRRGGMYCPSDLILDRLNRGMFAGVVSRNRMLDTISGIYGSNACLLSPYAALAYNGLLDYRIKTGISRPGLILSERSPLQDAAVTAQALGIAEEEIYKLM